MPRGDSGLCQVGNTNHHTGHPIILIPHLWIQTSADNIFKLVTKNVYPELGKVVHVISPLGRQGQADFSVRGQLKLYSGILDPISKKKKKNIYLEQMKTFFLSLFPNQYSKTVT